MRRRRIGEGPELVEVTAGAERCTGAAQVDLGNGVIDGCQPEGVHQVVERVADRRTVEGDVENVAGAGHNHGCTLASGALVRRR